MIPGATRSLSEHKWTREVQGTFIQRAKLKRKGESLAKCEEKIGKQPQHAEKDNPQWWESCDAAGGELAILGWKTKEMPEQEENEKPSRENERAARPLHAEDIPSPSAHSP